MELVWLIIPGTKGDFDKHQPECAWSTHNREIGTSEVVGGVFPTRIERPDFNLSRWHFEVPHRRPIHSCTKGVKEFLPGGRRLGMGSIPILTVKLSDSQ